jgi:hypothetical protein
MEGGDLRSASRFSTVGKMTLGQDRKVKPMAFSVSEFPFSQVKFLFSIIRRNRNLAKICQKLHVCK